jgi:hypothetical protein
MVHIVTARPARVNGIFFILPVTAFDPYYTVYLILFLLAVTCYLLFLSVVRTLWDSNINTQRVANKDSEWCKFQPNSDGTRLRLWRNALQHTASTQTENWMTEGSNFEGILNSTAKKDSRDIASFRLRLNLGFTGYKISVLAIATSDVGSISGRLVGHLLHMLLWNVLLKKKNFIGCTNLQEREIYRGILPCATCMMEDYAAK